MAGIFYPRVGDPYENNSPYTIIKADITYAGKTVTTYYPIDVIIDGIGEAKLEELLQFNIKGGCNCVLYNNTGNYPIYDKTPFLFNGPDIYKGQIFEAWTRSPHLHMNYSSNEAEYLNIV